MGGYVWLRDGTVGAIPIETERRLRMEGKRAVCVCGEQSVVQVLTMEQLLLDERYAGKGIVVETELLRQAGGINGLLQAKQEYELVLRIAQAENVAVFFDSEIFYELNASETGSESDTIKPQTQNFQEFVTDAYITGRYFSLLKEWNMADAVLEALLEACGKQSDPMAAQRFLEEMISHSERYDRLYQATQPVLIYLGPAYCYRVLRMFAEELAAALERQGQPVEFYDTEAEGIDGIGRLLGKQYKASVGFQTWLLSAKYEENRRMIQNLIGGPKYNFIVDHPVWLDRQLRETPDRYHVLTHDRNYIRFIREHYPQIAGVHLLPPGGGRTARKYSESAQNPTNIPEAIQKNRQFDIVFLGTYRNYRDGLAELASCPRERRFLAARYLGMMKRHTELPAERALKQILQATCEESAFSDRDFLQLMYELGFVVQIVMYYYREQVIQAILKEGLELHVYGETWRDSPFANHPGLVIHPEVPAEESIEVLQNARISLNIMAWHKDGFTERIADSMLAGAVVVSDYSTQLAENDADEVVLFDLRHLDALGGMLRKLLAEEEQLVRLAERARERALREATWDKRAEQLLTLIGEESQL